MADQHSSLEFAGIKYASRTTGFKKSLFQYSKGRRTAFKLWCKFISCMHAVWSVVCPVRPRLFDGLTAKISVSRWTDWSSFQTWRVVGRFQTGIIWLNKKTSVEKRPDKRWGNNKPWELKALTGSSSSSSIISTFWTQSSTCPVGHPPF